LARASLFSNDTAEKGHCRGLRHFRDFGTFAGYRS
jgi:hypothetical protein